MNKVFSEENQFPRTLIEARKAAGSTTYKQSKTVYNCVVFFKISVCIIQSVCLLNLLMHTKKTVNSQSHNTFNISGCLEYNEHIKHFHDKNHKTFDMYVIL